MELPRIQNVESLMMASFVIPIAVLSIFPHQEPRFILPVVLPLIFLFAHSIKNPSDIGQVNVADGKRAKPTPPSRKSKFELKIWYISNIVLALFYGFAHQGGVFPLTSNLSRELKAKPYLTHVHYFSSHTYPLPTSLLHLRNTRKLYQSDSGHKYMLTKDFYNYEFGSKSVEFMHNKLVIAVDECEKNWQFKRIPYRLYYALPYSFYNEFSEYALSNETQLFKFSLVKSFSPHISMEKLPQVKFPWECLHLSAAQNCVIDFIETILDNVVNPLRHFTLVLLQIEYINVR